MARQIFLHLGLFKTATTYLQEDIFPNLDGFFYLEKSFYRHSLLRDILYSDYLSFCQKADDIRMQFDALMGNAERVIISHEIFSGNPYYQSFSRYDIAQKLKRLFPDAKVIFGIRGQHSHIDSLYREYVVQGGVKSFQDFVCNPDGLPDSILDFDPHLNLDAFKYYHYVSHLAEQFGDGNVFTYPYEALRKDIDSFLEKLGAFLGTDIRALRLKTEARREGLGNLQLGVLRRVNRIYRSAFNKYGIIPYRFNISRALRWTNRLHNERANFLASLSLPVSFLDDNAKLDQRFDLALKRDHASDYF